MMDGDKEEARRSVLDELWEDVERMWSPEALRLEALEHAQRLPGISAANLVKVAREIERFIVGNEVQLELVDNARPSKPIAADELLSIITEVRRLRSRLRQVKDITVLSVKTDKALQEADEHLASVHAAIDRAVYSEALR